GKIFIVIIGMEMLGHRADDAIYAGTLRINGLSKGELLRRLNKLFPEVAEAYEYATGEKLDDHTVYMRFYHTCAYTNAKRAGTAGTRGMSNEHPIKSASLRGYYK